MAVVGGVENQRPNRGWGRFFPAQGAIHIQPLSGLCALISENAIAMYLSEILDHA